MPRVQLLALTCALAASLESVDEAGLLQFGRATRRGRQQDSLQGQEAIKEGWCSNWEHASIQKGGLGMVSHKPLQELADLHSVTLEEACWQACRDEDLCKQAVFENYGKWDDECWLGENDMEYYPSITPSRNYCQTYVNDNGDHCINKCYAKNGFSKEASFAPHPVPCPGQVTAQPELAGLEAVPTLAPLMMWPDEKCHWAEKGESDNERLFRDPVTGSSTSLTLEQCKDKCASTTDCKYYSFGAWKGGHVCMGCNGTQYKDTHTGFTLYELGSVN